MPELDHLQSKHSNSTDFSKPDLRH